MMLIKMMFWTVGAYIVAFGFPIGVLIAIANPALGLLILAVVLAVAALL